MILELEAPVVESIDKSTREVILSSSLASNTAEYLELKDAFVRGRPVVWYEAAQNTVDYSRDPHHPPRLTLLKGPDFVPEEFVGRSHQAENGTYGVECTTYGSSMSPHDVVLFSHGGDGETLGVNGRGGTLAYGLMAELGMEVLIESNFGGVSYRGVVEWVEVPGRNIKTLQFRYSTGERVWNEDEVFTRISYKVKSDTDWQMRQIAFAQLDELPNIFLAANPNYVGATLVPPREGAVAPAERAVFRIEGENKMVVAECLLGLSGEEQRLEKAEDTVWVGGLKVRSSQKYALPWAIWGGEHVRSSDYRVRRSVDSTQAWGAYAQVIKEALVRSVEPKVIQALLDANQYFFDASDSTEANFSDWEIPHELKVLSAQDCADEVLKAWQRVVKERYHGTFPLHTTDTEYARQAMALGHEVIYTPSLPFSAFLGQIGCERADKKLGIEKLQTEGYLFVRPRSLTECFTTLAGYLHTRAAEAQVLSTDTGEMQLWLTGTDVARDLQLDTFSSTPFPSTFQYSLLELVSHLGGLGKVKIEAANTDGIIHYEFRTENLSRGGKFFNECRIAVSARRNSNPSEVNEHQIILTVNTGEMMYPDLQNHTAERWSNALMVAMAGGKEQQFGGMTPEQIWEELQRLKNSKEDEAHQLERIKDLQNVVKRGAQKRLSLSDLWAGLSRGDVLGRSFETITALETARLGVKRLERESANKPRFRIRMRGVGATPGGYYRESLGDNLKMTEGGVEWEMASNRAYFEPLEGKTKQPTEWTLATEVQLLGDEWVSVPIRSDMNDVKHVYQDGLVVECNPVDGVIRARGVKGIVSFYQRRVFFPLFFDNTPPLEQHSQLPCDLRDLPDDLKRGLEVVARLDVSPEMRAAYVAQLHRQRFIYDDDPQIETRVMDNVSSVRDFAVNLLTVSRGTCNYAGTHLGLMWRLVGLPTQAVVGSVAGSTVSRMGDTHLWPRFWNGRKWISGEGASTTVAPWVRSHLIADEHPIPRHGFLNVASLLAGKDSVSNRAELAGREIHVEVMEMLKDVLSLPGQSSRLLQALAREHVIHELADLIDAAFLAAASNISKRAQKYISRSTKRITERDKRRIKKL